MGLYIPKSGNIYNLNDGKTHKLSISLLLQNPNYAIIGRTVQEELVFSIENLNINREKMHILFEEIVKNYEIQNLLDKRIDSLSGGQKQKISLISTLVSKPKVLILDEPTNLLDYAEINKFKELMNNIKKDRTIILISHNLLDTFDADRIFYINDKHELQIFNKIEFINFYISNKDLQNVFEIPPIWKLNKSFNFNITNNLDETIKILVNKKY